MTNDHDQLLWRSTPNCSSLDIYCGVGITEADLPHLSDPFLTPLPNGYNTSVIRQYAPRRNSSIWTFSVLLKLLKVELDLDFL